MRRVAEFATYAAFLIPLTGCSDAHESMIQETMAAAESQDVWMALTSDAGDKQDLYLSNTVDAVEMNVCVIKRGAAEDDGVCIPADKDGRYFKVAGVAMSHEMVIKISAKTANGIESKRKVEIREAGRPVTPVSTQPAIPAAMDLALKSADGTDTKVSAVFKKKYLLVELSAYDCGPCRSFAQDFNRQEARYRSYFEEGQCSKLVLIDDYGGLRGRYRDWISMLGGANSYLGKASYNSNVGLKQAATAMGFNRQFGIPTLFVVDRTGKVVDSATAAMPSKMAELCTNGSGT